MACSQREAGDGDLWPMSDSVGCAVVGGSNNDTPVSQDCECVPQTMSQSSGCAVPLQCRRGAPPTPERACVCGCSTGTSHAFPTLLGQAIHAVTSWFLRCLAAGSQAVNRMSGRGAGSLLETEEDTSVTAQMYGLACCSQQGSLVKSCRLHSAWQPSHRQQGRSSLGQHPSQEDETTPKLSATE